MGRTSGGTAGVGQPVGSQVLISPYGALAASTGTWTALANAVGWTSLHNSSAAQNDDVAFDAYVSTGTWQLGLLMGTATSGGIITPNLGGTNLATIDSYAAATGIKQTVNAGSVALTTGLTTVTLTVTSKNASSSGYNLYLIDCVLTRTA